MYNTLLRPQEAAKYLAISKSTFWRWVSEGKLPKGTHLSPRVTVWRQSDLDAFIESMFDSSKDEDVNSTDEKNIASAIDVFIQSPNQKTEIPVLALPS